jgi:hypothetical protein
MTLLGCALIGLATPAAAQYQMQRWTVDGGGSSAMTGGDYSLSGTAGQADAGALQSATYTLDGGFWGSMDAVPVDVPDLDDEQEQVLSLRIFPPLPNPARAGAQIRFQIPDPRPVQVRVYNVRGELVRTLVQRALPAGPHLVDWDTRGASGRPVSSGIYFVRVQLGETIRTHRLTVIR